jgi:hypothetical protein
MDLKSDSTVQSLATNFSRPDPHTEVSQDGLSQEEVQRRLAQYGYNELPEKKTNPLLKFMSYFWGPIPWMIEAAVVLSALVRHWPDFFIILVLLLANAVVGFWEEYQAGNAIAALKAKLAIRAENRDTIDLAVLSGVKDPQQLNSYSITHFQPFDPVHKRTEATFGNEEKSQLEYMGCLYGKN